MQHYGLQDHPTRADGRENCRVVLLYFVMRLSVSRREKLHSYSIRLRTDQVTFLRSQQHPAEFLRAALDKTISQVDKTPETPEDQIIRLTKQIELIEAQIKGLQEDPEFQEAESMLNNLPELKRHLDDKKGRLMKALETGMEKAKREGISVEKIDKLEKDEEYRSYFLRLFSCEWGESEDGKTIYIAGKANLEERLKKVEEERLELEQRRTPYLQQISAAFKAKIKELEDQRGQLISNIESIKLQR